MQTRHILRAAVLLSVFSLSAFQSFSPFLPAAETTFNAGDTLPATSANGDIWTLTGTPALRPATGATITVAASNTLTIQSDTPDTWRTIGAVAASNANMFSIASGATLNLDHIILLNAKTTGNNAAADGAAFVLAAGTGITTINGPFIIDSATMTSRANGGGAAINAANPFVINDGVTIQNSYAAGSGAGIYTTANFTIAGSSTFANNQANGSNGGGAILFYVTAGTGTLGILDASKGDITFTGNTASGTASGISIRTAVRGKLDFETGAGADAHTIYFYDPILGVTTAVADFVQNGDGTVVFDKNASTISAISAINSGTLKLTRGAILGTGNALGSFALAGPATLSGNGTILTNSTTLAAGSTLEVLGNGALTLNATTYTYDTTTGINLRGSGTIAPGPAITAANIAIGTLTPDNPDTTTALAGGTRAAQTLTISPTTALTIANGGTLAFNLFTGNTSDLLVSASIALAGNACVNIIGAGSGSYKIISSTDTDLSLLTPNLSTLINGLAPAGRYGAVLSASTTLTDYELWVAFASGNIATTWAGAPAATWSNSPTADANWNAPADTHFINGDRVTFDDTAASKTVTIAPAGVIVADMLVNNTAGNDYTFDGSGGITASATDSTSLAAPTAKLVKTGAGALNFTNTAPNTFEGGIELSGGTLGFTAANQLGDGGNGIAFTGNSTLHTNTNNLTLANNLSIATGVTATLDTGANTLTHTGLLAAADATATLAKTGAGTLNLTANNASYTGATAIQQGTLNINAGAQLGGAVTLASNATLAGSGTLTGSLAAAANSIIRIGDTSAAPSHLTIASLDLNAAILQFNIFDANASDQLNVTNLAFSAPATANTIDINSGFSGTYNLGNIAALAPATVTIDGNTQAADSRSTATLAAGGIANLDLILTVGADMSRIMYWTGANGAAWSGSNWTDTTTKDLFANGDTVIFDSTADAAHPASRSITLAAPVTVSDMRVTGDADYTFTGAGGITADPASVNPGAITAATGKLVKTGAGTLAFTNAADNTFTGGIEISGGAISFTAANQLGDGGAGGHGIAFTGNSTLAAASNNLTLANNLTIAAAITATIDTGANTLTHTGLITSAAPTSTLVKTGAGTLNLAADNSPYTGATAIQQGTLNLATGAKLGGPVTLTGSTATLSGAGALTGSVTAAPDTIIRVGGNPAASGTLTIAALTLNAATLTFNIFADNTNDQLIANTVTLAAPSYINITGAGTGSYKIITSAATDFSTLLPNLTTLVNGAAPTGRFGAIISASTAPADYELWVAFATTNIALTWTGAQTPLWASTAATDANWLNSAAIDNHFINGDRVTFDDTPATADARSITIAPAGVIVADMLVNNSAGNDYTFTGAGGITASATNSTGLAAPAPTAKLVKTGAGSLNFANTGTNTFAGGIEISGGAISFTDAAQLGDGGHGIAFTGNSTLAASAGNLTLANNLAIAAGVAATLDTGANTLTATGSITSANATATLDKTGSGLLTLTGNNTDFTGATNIQQGALDLAAGATLGGSVNIAASATLAAAGTLGALTAGPNSVLQIGSLTATTAQTLTLASLALTTGNIINFDLYTGANDQLNVTGAITGATATDIINVTSGFTGTFNLGAAAALAVASVTLDGHALAPNSRSAATLSASGASLLLTLGADMSRVMYWTGNTGTLWNIADTDWTDKGDKNTYAAGDTVIFDSTADAANPANRAITIQGSGVTVSDMTVRGDANYTFTGAGITADSASVMTGTITAATGKLIKTDTNTLTFANTANNFKGGIDLGGGVIAFSDGAQLATSASTGITFTDSATLRPTAAATLATNIAITTGVTGVLDTATAALTYTGTLSAASATATLAKTGAGALILATADNSAYTGQIAVNSGALLLSDAALGGAVNTGSGATFGGAGTAATVNALASSTINVTGGLLAIAALNLDDASTLIGSGTLAGATALPGNATANIAAGQNLILAAATTGAGNLTKTGAGSLTYSGAPSLAFTGATIITSGSVLLRDIATPAAIASAFTINGGWLDLSDSTYDPTGATANNWSSLHLAQGATAGGGVIGSNDKLTLTGGNIAFAIGDPANAAKQGIFVVIDAGTNTVTLTGANNYSGWTRIDSGILNITAATQIGNAANAQPVILNGGTLQLSGNITASQRSIQLNTDGVISSSANTTTLWNAITNTTGAPRTLAKSGAGAFTLAGANAATALNVTAGSFIAQNAAGAGKGDVTVAGGALFSFATPAATGAVSNRFTGAGTLSVASGASITLTGSNDIANVQVTATATLTAATANAISPAAAVTISNAATLNLAAPSTALGAVTLANGGALAFAPGGAFKQATVLSLASTGAGNTLSFNTNIAAQTGDHLTVLRPINGGAYTLAINNTGGAPATTAATLNILTATIATGTFTLANDKVDAGVYSFTLQSSAANGQFNLNLVNAPGQLSNTAQIINNMSGAQALDWFTELTGIQNRMGQLRQNTDGPRNRATATWLRGYGQQYRMNANPTGTPFTSNIFGAEAGLDRKLEETNGNLYLGLLVGYGQSLRDFAAAGSGRSDNAYAGAYATLATTRGWYGSIILKGDQFKNRVDGIDTAGNSVTARYTAYGAGLSLEGGKSITLTPRWYLEPQLQGEFATISGATYTTSNAFDIRLDRLNTTQARAGLQLGYNLAHHHGDTLQAYAKLQGGYQWTIGGNLFIDDNRFAPKIEGRVFAAGLGISTTFSRLTQLYFEYLATTARDYTSPWSFSIGVRHSW